MCREPHMHHTQNKKSFTLRHHHQPPQKFYSFSWLLEKNTGKFFYTKKRTKRVRETKVESVEDFFLLKSQGLFLEKDILFYSVVLFFYSLERKKSMFLVWCFFWRVSGITSHTTTLTLAQSSFFFITPNQAKPQERTKWCSEKKVSNTFLFLLFTSCKIYREYKRMRKIEKGRKKKSHFFIWRVMCVS